LSQIGMEAREKAIRVEMENVDNRIKKEAENDEMLRALKELTELRERGAKLAEEMYRGDKISRKELDQAIAQSLEVRIQYLSAAAKKRADGGGDQLESFATELSKIAIDSAESKVKQKHLETCRDEIQSDLLSQKIAESRLRDAKDHLRLADAEVKQVEEQLAKLKNVEEKVEPIKVKLFQIFTSSKLYSGLNP
jgi:hypothetical protein